jgi:hypothetical protein
MQDRSAVDFKPLHVVSLPVRDTPRDAEIAMEDLTMLVEMVRVVRI